MASSILGPGKLTNCTTSFSHKGLLLGMNGSSIVRTTCSPTILFPDSVYSSFMTLVQVFCHTMLWRGGDALTYEAYTICANLFIVSASKRNVTERMRWHHLAHIMDGELSEHCTSCSSPLKHDGMVDTVNQGRVTLPATSNSTSRALASWKMKRSKILCSTRKKHTAAGLPPQSQSFLQGCR